MATNITHSFYHDRDGVVRDQSDRLDQGGNGGALSSGGRSWDASMGQSLERSDALDALDEEIEHKEELTPPKPADSDDKPHTQDVKDEFIPLTGSSHVPLYFNKTDGEIVNEFGEIVTDAEMQHVHGPRLAQLAGDPVVDEWKRDVRRWQLQPENHVARKGGDAYDRHIRNPHQMARPELQDATIYLARAQEALSSLEALSLFYQDKLSHGEAAILASVQQRAVQITTGLEDIAVGEVISDKKLKAFKRDLPKIQTVAENLTQMAALEEATDELLDEMQSRLQKPREVSALLVVKLRQSVFEAIETGDAALRDKCLRLAHEYKKTLRHLAKVVSLKSQMDARADTMVVNREAPWKGKYGEEFAEGTSLLDKELALLKSEGGLDVSQVLDQQPMAVVYQTRLFAKEKGHWDDVFAYFNGIEGEESLYLGRSGVFDAQAIDGQLHKLAAFSKKLEGLAPKMSHMIEETAAYVQSQKKGLLADGSSLTELEVMGDRAAQLQYFEARLQKMAMGADISDAEVLALSKRVRGTLLAVQRDLRNGIIELGHHDNAMGVLATISFILETDGPYQKYYERGGRDKVFSGNVPDSITERRRQKWVGVLQEREQKIKWRSLASAFTGANVETWLRDDSMSPRKKEQKLKGLIHRIQTIRNIQLLTQKMRFGINSIPQFAGLAVAADDKTWKAARADFTKASQGDVEAQKALKAATDRTSAIGDLKRDLEKTARVLRGEKGLLDHCEANFLTNGAFNKMTHGIVNGKCEWVLKHLPSLRLKLSEASKYFDVAQKAYEEGDYQKSAQALSKAYACFQKMVYSQSRKLVMAVLKAREEHLEKWMLIIQIGLTFVSGGLSTGVRVLAAGAARALGASAKVAQFVGSVAHSVSFSAAMTSGNAWLFGTKFDEREFAFMCFSFLGMNLYIEHRIVGPMLMKQAIKYRDKVLQDMFKRGPVPWERLTNAQRTQVMNRCTQMAQADQTFLDKIYFHVQRIAQETKFMTFKWMPAEYLAREILVERSFNLERALFLATDPWIALNEVLMQVLMEAGGGFVRMGRYPAHAAYNGIKNRLAAAQAAYHRDVAAMNNGARAFDSKRFGQALGKLEAAYRLEQKFLKAVSKFCDTRADQAITQINIHNLQKFRRDNAPLIEFLTAQDIGVQRDVGKEFTFLESSAYKAEPLLQAMGAVRLGNGAWRTADGLVFKPRAPSEAEAQTTAFARARDAVIGRANNAADRLVDGVGRVKERAISKLNGFAEGVFHLFNGRQLAFANVNPHARPHVGDDSPIQVLRPDMTTDYTPAEAGPTVMMMTGGGNGGANYANGKKIVGRLVEESPPESQGQATSQNYFERQKVNLGLEVATTRKDKSQLLTALKEAAGGLTVDDVPVSPQTMQRALDDFIDSSSLEAFNFLLRCEAALRNSEGGDALLEAMPQWREALQAVYNKENDRPFRPEDPAKLDAPTEPDLYANVFPDEVDRRHVVDTDEYGEPTANIPLGDIMDYVGGRTDGLDGTASNPQGWAEVDPPLTKTIEVEPVTRPPDVSNIVVPRASDGDTAHNMDGHGPFQDVEPGGYYSGTPVSDTPVPVSIAELRYVSVGPGAPGSHVPAGPGDLGVSQSGSTPPLGSNVSAKESTPASTTRSPDANGGRGPFALDTDEFPAVSGPAGGRAGRREDSGLLARVVEVSGLHHLPDMATGVKEAVVSWRSASGVYYRAAVDRISSLLDVRKVAEDPNASASRPAGDDADSDVAHGVDVEVVDRAGDLREESGMMGLAIVKDDGTVKIAAEDSEMMGIVADRVGSDKVAETLVERADVVSGSEFRRADQRATNWQLLAGAAAVLGLGAVGVVSMLNGNDEEERKGESTKELLKGIETEEDFKAFVRHYNQEFVPGARPDYEKEEGAEEESITDVDEEKERTPQEIAAEVEPMAAFLELRQNSNYKPVDPKEAAAAIFKAGDSVVGRGSVLGFVSNEYYSRVKNIRHKFREITGLKGGFWQNLYIDNPDLFTQEQCKRYVEGVYYFRPESDCFLEITDIHVDVHFTSERDYVLARLPLDRPNMDQLVEELDELEKHPSTKVFWEDCKEKALLSQAMSLRDGRIAYRPFTTPGSSKECTKSHEDQHEMDCLNSDYPALVNPTANFYVNAALDETVDDSIASITQKIDEEYANAEISLNLEAGAYYGDPIKFQKFKPELSNPFFTSPLYRPLDRDEEVKFFEDFYKTSKTPGPPDIGKVVDRAIWAHINPNNKDNFPKKVMELFSALHKIRDACAHSSDCDDKKKVYDVRAALNRCAADEHCNHLFLLKELLPYKVDLKQPKPDAGSTDADASSAGNAHTQEVGP
jgi:hypothetical protein